MSAAVLDPVRVRTAELAALAAVGGLVAALPLPTALRGLLVALFVLVGPGGAITSHVDLPISTRAYAVPALGLTVILLTTWAAVTTTGMRPTAVLVVVALASLATAAPRTRWARWRT